MSYSTKNKILIGVLLLLVLANIATITVFWLGKGRPPLSPKGSPTDYLVKELGFDAKQKEAFLGLVQAHRTQAESLRQQVKTAKDNFFKLLQQPGITDSGKMAAAKNISQASEQLDLITFDHFKKVRALCNADQQKKFDSIIQDVMHMVGGPGQGAAGMHGPRLQGPPPDDREGEPPPPGREDGLPPPHP
jgi:periplasmic protein CpxP/Spy